MFGREVEVEVRESVRGTPTPLVTFPADEATPTPTASPTPTPGPTPTPTTPGQVQNMTAGPTGGSGEVIVTWDPSPASDGVDHYNIYRQNGPCAGSFTGTVMDSVSASGPAWYIDTGLTPGNTYCYAVSAVDAAGNEGELSEPDPGVPEPTPTPTPTPAPPTPTPTPTP
jgi:hypothetical protein